MSAYLDPRIGILYFKEGLTPEEKEFAKAMISTAFDESSDYDVQAQEQAQKFQEQHNRQMKKFYTFKLLIFPFEWMLIRVIMGPKEARGCWEVFKKIVRAVLGKGDLDATIRQAAR